MFSKGGVKLECSGRASARRVREDRFQQGDGRVQAFRGRRAEDHPHDR